MSQIEHTAIREPGAESAVEFARRVRRLACFYVFLFCGSLAGIGLLVWQAQFFVTLSQRSNVETLVIAFVLVFFGYLASLSAPGALGALRLGYYALRLRLGYDRAAIARQMRAALGRAPARPATAALNRVVVREGCRDAFRLAVGDADGEMGGIEVDGAAIRHVDSQYAGSNSLLAYCVHQVNALLGRRGVADRLDVVYWQTIDDEGTEQYLALVGFARRLEAHLAAPALWPRVTLTDADCAELERCLTAVCAAVRYEAFLPQWEYAGEHKLPLIPEPLGLVSLSRTERRVDPEASMGCAVLIVGAVLGVLLLFILFPPWVPGI